MYDPEPSTAPDFETSLLAVPKAVPELRRTLSAYRPHPDLALCVSELLSNVIRHLGEGTPVTVRVTGGGAGRIRVAVTDPDPRALPVLRHATGDEEAGRGLALLDAVSLRWGVEQGADSKTVWCELGEGRARRAGS
ncbi:ATP-binding protein [Streptomyces sp. NPDC017988]|uniref:ATP-binding protein n=1 Tax=Streptomyces sp. NPDC017988 TaxID=3365025 RepID=UPI0037941453